MLLVVLKKLFLSIRVAIGHFSSNWLSSSSRTVKVVARNLPSYLTLSPLKLSSKVPCLRKQHSTILENKPQVGAW